MNQDFNNLAQPPLNMGMAIIVIRLIVTVIGLGITLFGVKYTLEIFLLLYNSLQAPETLTPFIAKWGTLLNIKDFSVLDYPLDKLLTVVILAIGTLLLLRITLGFIQAGVSMLINVANDSRPPHHTTTGYHTVAGNIDYKLNKLKIMANQGVISQKAYDEARDKYLVEKVMLE